MVLNVPKKRREKFCWYIQEKGVVYYETEKNYAENDRRCKEICQCFYEMRF